VEFIFVVDHHVCVVIVNIRAMGRIHRTTVIIALHLVFIVRLVGCSSGVQVIIGFVTGICVIVDIVTRVCAVIGSLTGVRIVIGFVAKMWVSVCFATRIHVVYTSELVLTGVTSRVIVMTRWGLGPWS